jgi:hypothetical protein
MLCGSGSFCVKNSYEICSVLCRLLWIGGAYPTMNMFTVGCGSQQYIAGFDVNLFVSMCDGVASNVDFELLWG